MWKVKKEGQARTEEEGKGDKTREGLTYFITTSTHDNEATPLIKTLIHPRSRALVTTSPLKDSPSHQSYTGD
jgi:hypothetical protein